VAAVDRPTAIERDAAHRWIIATDFARHTREY
jgi:hypothetical protein